MADPEKIIAVDCKHVLVQGESGLGLFDESDVIAKPVSQKSPETVLIDDKCNSVQVVLGEKGVEVFED